MKKSSLKVYDYVDYREFIRDRLEELQAKDKKYSKRWFVQQQLGIRSGATYINDIINGKRKVSRSLIQIFPKALGLSRKESEFFRCLIRYGDAKSENERMAAMKDLKRSKVFVETHQLDIHQFEYYANPILLALRELVTTGDFREDPHWIAERLQIPAQEKEIEQAIQELIKAEHLTRDKAGRLQQTALHIRTGNQFEMRDALRAYHRNMLKLASESIELPIATRYLRGLSVSCTDESYKEICEEIETLIDRIRAIVDQEQDAPKHVYHFASGFYPLTRIEDTRKDQ